MSLLLILLASSCPVVFVESYKLEARKGSKHSTVQDEEFVETLEYEEDCNEKCHLKIIKEASVRESFHEYLEDKEINLVYFNVVFPNHSSPVLETYPYMKSAYKASRWVWASKGIGKRMLELPFDADVLSLHLLNFKTPVLKLSITETPPRCFVMLASYCRLVAIRSTIANDVVLRSHSLDDGNPTTLVGTLLCHYQFTNGPNASSLVHQCCPVSKRTSTECQLMVYNEDDFSMINVVSFLLAAIVTLYSPLLVVRLKQFLVFEKSTKFFRASLKHGITGQCSYVIRISYRQLVDLNDSSPFSLPKSFLRLVLHCYGEGRCCIHWWGSWPHQPSVCMSSSRLRRFWFILLKTLGVLLVYPWALHLAVGFYLPRVFFYKEIQEHASSSPNILPVELQISALGVRAVLSENLPLCIWILFSLVSFFYTLVVLSWNDNPVERYILRTDSKKPSNHVKILRKHFSSNYKSILQELAYGTQEDSLNYFFQLPWRASKFKRIIRAGAKTLWAFVPVVNVCARLYPRNFYEARNVSEEMEKEGISRRLCRAATSAFIWIIFALLLSGYSTIVFLIVEFCLKVAFFVLLACFIYPSTLFPMMCSVLSLCLYANGFLSQINFQHRYILKLIDENSPRLSAIEESELEDSTIHLLRSHSLGAVKFIDGDGTEYVSKELYFGVCDDLKFGWSRCLRQFAKRMFVLVLYTMVVLVFVKMLNFLWSNEGSFAVFVAITGSVAPKMVEIAFRFRGRDEVVSKKMRWSKNIPDVLDKHIKVDRMRSARVEGEEFLSTYDVRPVGSVEMELPRYSMFRTLELWKFPWIVSCEQQTQTNEFYVNALANRMAAISFLARAVSKNLPGKIDTEASLRRWTMMVESCILESSSKALSLQFAPFSDSSRLFPPELQPLLFSIDAGNSVDSLVDNINRELYGFYVSAVLANVNTSSCAILKFGDNQLMAFNGACHADHFSDFYGAVMIVTDFNAQNLQLMIKFLIDHQHPDSVPVYSPLAAEAFVLRSAEVLDIESVV